MLHRRRHDGVEQWFSTMGNRIDRDHLALTGWAVILRKLAERPLDLPDLR